jgi:hypothetical protein
MPKNVLILVSCLIESLVVYEILTHFFLSEFEDFGVLPSAL